VTSYLTHNHVNIREIKSKFKHIRENFPQLNRYNLDCTRAVVHIYVSFTWYNFSEIVPLSVSCKFLVQVSWACVAGLRIYIIIKVSWIKFLKFVLFLSCNIIRTLKLKQSYESVTNTLRFFTSFTTASAFSFQSSMLVAYCAPNYTSVRYFLTN